MWHKAFLDEGDITNKGPFNSAMSFCLFSLITPCVYSLKLFLMWAMLPIVYLVEQGVAFGCNNNEWAICALNYDV